MRNINPTSLEKEKKTPLAKAKNDDLEVVNQEANRIDETELSCMQPVPCIGDINVTNVKQKCDACYQVKEDDFFNECKETLNKQRIKTFLEDKNLPSRGRHCRYMRADIKETKGLFNFSSKKAKGEI